MSSIVYCKYPKEHTFNGARVLNIGCGFAQYRAPNVTNVDAEAVCNPDLVWDLSKTPMPFPDEHFDHIIANHILEHVPGWWNCFNDCARMLKPGGKLEVWVPGVGSDAVLGYRDHINTINPCSFFGISGTTRNLTNAWAESNAISSANRLKMQPVLYKTESHWWLRYAPRWVLCFAADHLRNVISENGYIFTKMTQEQYLIEERKERARVQSVRNSLVQVP